MNPTPILLAILVPILANRWGRRRRAAGLPVSPRERLTLALMIWAIGLPAVMLPEILKATIVPPADKVIAISIFLAAGVAPLAVVQFIRWSLGLVRRWEGDA